MLRSFNLVGPGQAPNFVVPDFCAQVSEIVSGDGRGEMLVGNLNVERDFTDVRDGVEALRRVMQLENPKAAYNVASGRPVKIRQILDWILDEAGIKPEIHVESSRLRENEVACIQGDASRLRTDIDWVPQRSIETSVREVYRWTARRWERGNTEFGEGGIG